MGMIDALRTKFRELPNQEKLWMIEIMREWSTSGDEFQRYDGRALLPEFEASLNDA